MPEGCRAAVDYEAWDRPPIFNLLQEKGDVPEADMRRTFNLGVGLVAIVRADALDDARERLDAVGETPVRIGRVEATRGG
jgi:phosphoribosylformylglycinamidine cyclo-ligase